MFAAYASSYLVVLSPGQQTEAVGLCTTAMVEEAAIGARALLDRLQRHDKERIE
jgi:hypothetical protein